MDGRIKGILGVAGGLLAAWVGWGVYAKRTTDRVPYETVESFDGVEIRRYPQAVLVETTAPDEGTAFRRLFRYISGANEASEEVSMTSPVRTDGERVAMTAPVRTTAAGAKVAMTAPVRTDRNAGDVTMAFYLPAEYTPASAPTPTDSAVRLVVEPPRTVAARRFTWYATPRRTARMRRTLLDALADRGVAVRGEPELLQYDDPFTPPFMRHNEVVVEVEA